MSYRIVLCHIMPCRIITYHIMSHHIICLPGAGHNKHTTNNSNYANHIHIYIYIYIYIHNIVRGQPSSAAAAFEPHYPHTELWSALVVLVLFTLLLLLLLCIDVVITIIIIIIIIISRPTSHGGAPDAHRSCRGPRLRAMRVRDPFPDQLVADKWGQH